MQEGKEEHFFHKNKKKARARHLHTEFVPVPLPSPPSSLTKKRNVISLGLILSVSNDVGTIL